MRVIVTGGGTGGHITPIKPITKLLNGDTEQNITMFIGQRGDSFADLISIGEDVQHKKAIYSGKYRRYPNQSTFERLLDIPTHLKNLRDLFLIGLGVVQSVFTLWRFKPDVVFGKGGYVSVPVGLAARILRVPLVIHESDALPGLANRILSPSAAYIALGMPIEEEKSVFDSSKTKFTGIPLRSEFVEMASKKSDIREVKQQLSLDPDKPLLVVTGGSLGAQAINTAVINALGDLLEFVQIVHVTGENNFEAVLEQAGDLSGHNDYHPVAFTHEIHDLFYASEVVISRASATFFSELAMLGVVSILIPASQLEDQQHNAKLAADRQAAEVLYEADLEADNSLLVTTVKTLLGDKEKTKKMQTNIQEFASEGAAFEIVELLKKAAGRGVKE